MSTLIVIPARYDSTRFPGKPLVKISGVSLIQRVYKICTRVSPGVKAVVATDDVRILDHVKSFGGEVMMTSRNHPSGTDRVAEVARKYPSKIVINVQGDEPLLQPSIIRKLEAAMQKDRKIMMGTLCHPIHREADYEDPNVVKVVLNHDDEALYFSRSTIPHVRDGKLSFKKLPRIFYRHIGIYAFRREFLLKYVKWPQSSLEKLEKLEQLRALENGVRIKVLKTEYEAIGVDVPADVKKVENLLKS